jgi:hypothetical protein
MHPQTRKCHEFLLWRSRFEDSTDVAPEGASYAEILASLNSDERVTTTPLVAERGEAWVAVPLTSEERLQAPAANSRRMTGPVSPVRYAGLD